MSESLAGVTFLAFGNGSPDVFSTFAAMSSDSSSLAIGELIGAAGFITGVVAGSMALVRPFKVVKKSFIRDVGFFAVAAAFSMGFLSDGHLHLWECIVMVMYYFFYVAVVVLWHWWYTRREARRKRNDISGGQFTSSVPEDESYESYRDDPDDTSTIRPLISREASRDSFAVLEHSNSIPRIEVDHHVESQSSRDHDGHSMNAQESPHRHHAHHHSHREHEHRSQDDNSDEDDAVRDRKLEVLTHNMHLRRPGIRRNTIKPVRPSLVGALEFQAAVNSIHKLRNLQSLPMHGRRHSEDPLHSSGYHRGSLSALPENATAYFEEPSTSAASAQDRAPVTGRVRAASTSDVLTPKTTSKWTRPAAYDVSPSIAEVDEDTVGLSAVLPNQSNNSGASHAGPSSNMVDEPTKITKPYDQQNASDDTVQSDPPDTSGSEVLGEALTLTESPEQVFQARPALASLQIPSVTRIMQTKDLRSSSMVDTPNLTTTSPNSRPSSLYFASVSSLAELEPLLSLTAEDQDAAIPSPPFWWPSSILPNPATLLSTLIPTLYNVQGKSWWEIVLAFVAAPSVFLLTITLPVMDIDKDDAGEYEKTPPPAGRDKTQSSTTPGAGPSPVNNQIDTTPAAIDSTQTPTLTLWNRWLFIIQIYLAPLLTISMLYTQYIPLPPSSSPDAILPLQPILISLFISTLLLIPLFIFTTPTYQPPVFRPLLSLMGFVISIVWISTIATQVVALLKILAIILNMSQAILGLTVFAVGNSLGDLVADITVARLGYPVMALSACFGGPMLNILLGIGLSGCWILGFKNKSNVEQGGNNGEYYRIHVGDTLIISGITLLVTLVGLLIAVPLNGWMMDRKIAWGLIALWCTGTLINVSLEIWSES